MTDFCNEVWSKEGTCCDGKDMFQFVTNWLTAFKKNFNETRVIVPIFKKSLSYVDVVKRVMALKKADITKAAMTAKQFDDFGL